MAVCIKSKVVRSGFPLCGRDILCVVANTRARPVGFLYIVRRYTVNIRCNSWFFFGVYRCAVSLDKQFIELCFAARWSILLYQAIHTNRCGQVMARVRSASHIDGKMTDVQAPAKMRLAHYFKLGVQVVVTIVYDLARDCLRSIRT
jgi:hypothetical protein